MKLLSRESLTNKAINLLSFRPRSTAELRFRLKRLTPDTSMVDQVIIQLEAENILNDQKFAAWWVEQRCRFRPKGNRALLSELMQKGVDKDIIAGSLLSSEQEKLLAKDLIVAKGITDKEVIFNRLASRGFSTSTIAAVIDELGQKE